MTDRCSCRHENLSGIMRDHLCGMRLYTSEIGATLRSVTEIAPKSPFLSVNRSSIQYDFRAGVKAFRYTVNKVRLEKQVKMHVG